MLLTSEQITTTAALLTRTRYKASKNTSEM